MKIHPEAAILVKVATSLAADIRVSDEGMMASHQMSLVKHFHSDNNYLKEFSTCLLLKLIFSSSKCLQVESAFQKKLEYFISN